MNAPLDPVGLWALFVFAVVTIAGCVALWYCTGLPDPDRCERENRDEQG